MFTKIALAAALIAATSTVSLATEFDPNPANRYPAYTDPIALGPTTQDTFRTSAASLSAGQGFTGRPVELQRDRASSPSAGGVG
jgi:hypothetical protein